MVAVCLLYMEDLHDSCPLAVRPARPEVTPLSCVCSCVCAIMCQTGVPRVAWLRGSAGCAFEPALRFTLITASLSLEL